MRLTITSLVAAILSWMLCAQTAAGNQNDESSRATLRGIRRMVIVINFQGDGLQQFERARITRDVEQRLVMAGISLLSLDQIVGIIASGEKVIAPADYLYVYVNTVKSLVSPMSARSISIEVNRRVRLDGPGETARAVTWKANRVFMFVTSVLRDSMRGAVSDELEEFVQAYGSVNGK